jgi:hypothetical protein
MNVLAPLARPAGSVDAADVALVIDCAGSGFFEAVTPRWRALLGVSASAVADLEGDVALVIDGPLAFLVGCSDDPDSDAAFEGDPVVILKVIRVDLPFELDCA